MPPADPRPQRPDAVRVAVDPGGPVLVEGPVEVRLPDGTTARSDRFQVAICACRRSKTYPFCDTSHRRKVRTPQERTPAGGRDGGQSGSSSDERPADH